MFSNKKLSCLSVSLFVLVFGCSTAFAQTSAFTYQGKMNDGGTAANGQYDFNFRLLDNGGFPTTAVVVEDVQVTAGIFTVNLDFTGTPFTSNTARFLEIAVRPGASTGLFTPLSPNQPLTSAPYSVKSLNADTATNSTQLGGVAANQYVTTTSGGTNFIQNSTSPQAASNFNISGGGTANIFNAATQYNIGGNRVLSVAGSDNLFAGLNSGIANTGTANSFFGTGSGQINGSGSGNSFFGTQAGQSNTTGNLNAAFGVNANTNNSTGNGNSIFGFNAGLFNTTSGNSFFGSSAGQANVTGPQNAFFGFESGMNNTSGSNSFFGSGSGRVNTTGGLNAFFGTQAGTANTIGSRNAFFGSGAGFRTTIGSDNTFLGLAAGDPNTEGNRNTIIGSLAGASNTTENGNTFIGYTANGTAGITNATAIGASSLVSQSDSLVLGNNVKVGIGTSAPDFKLEVADKANTGLRVVTGSPGGTVASFGGNGVFQVDAPFIPAGRLKISESGKVFVPQPSSLVLRAPDNGCWAVSVSNTGVLSAVSVACP